MPNYQNQNDDWAQRIPRDRADDLPYEDFGWERRTSVLPEFRDPYDRFMPRERERVGRWWDLDRTPNGDYGIRGAWDAPGPYRGIGPKNYHRSDQRIFEDVCERISRHGQLNAKDIDIQVKDGEVILNGEVDSRREKRLAEDIAESVSGVKDIQNHLRARQMQETSAQRGDRQTTRQGGRRLPRQDYVGRSGVYPASGPLPNRDAEVQGMASWGQGKRGAQGYYDHGDSELNLGQE